MRDAQRDATRERIVRAVAELLAEQNPAVVSVELIAARAGTSVATLYRHFRNKEALLDAVATFGYESTRERRPRAGRDAEPLRDFLPRRWSEILANADLFRAQQATAAGRAVRRRRRGPHREATERGLASEGIDVTTATGQRLRDLTLLLSSSVAALELCDQLGVDVEDAAAHAVWAIEQLTQATLQLQEADRRSAP